MNHTNNLIKVALADDHVVLRKGLGNLIDGFGNCQVILQADNGKELIEGIAAGRVPDVLILDQMMPVMNGYEVACWLYKNHSQVLILILSMYDSDLQLIRLLKNGVRGFLKKDIHPNELKFAIESVMSTGFYYSREISPKVIKVFRNDEVDQMWKKKSTFSEREIEFIKLCATELTYKSMAEKMNLSARVIENIRVALFERLDVNTRVGLVMIGVRHGLVEGWGGPPGSSPG